MNYEEWQDCPVKGCTNKCCTWLGEGYCYPHTKLDKKEKDMRYRITHDYQDYLFKDYAIRLINYLEFK